MNLSFVAVEVALTGLFGMAFAIFGVLHSRKQGGGKQGSAQSKRPSQDGSSDITTRSPKFHDCTTPVCSKNIPGQDPLSPCFGCLSPAWLCTMSTVVEWHNTDLIID